MKQIVKRLWTPARPYVIRVASKIWGARIFAAMMENKTIDDIRPRVFEIRIVGMAFGYGAVLIIWACQICHKLVYKTSLETSDSTGSDREIETGPLFTRLKFVHAKIETLVWEIKARDVIHIMND